MDAKDGTYTTSQLGGGGGGENSFISLQLNDAALLSFLEKPIPRSTFKYRQLMVV
jgi:hypothetical protein